MKIKMLISIIAIIISSISMAEAGQNHRKYDRHYGEHRAHYRKNHHRSDWKRERHARQHYREQRHHRKHHYKRHHRSHRTYNSRWERSHRTYYSPRIYTSHRVIISGRGHSNSTLPVVAGGLIGSVIANDASHGDPVATFGGAVFGALVGRALSHH